MKSCEGVEIWLRHSWSRHWVEVSAQLYSPAALSPENEPQYSLGRSLVKLQSLSGHFTDIDFEFTRWHYLVLVWWLNPQTSSSTIKYTVKFLSVVGRLLKCEETGCVVDKPHSSSSDGNEAACEIVPGKVRGNLTKPMIFFFNSGLWGYWHCGHSWPIVPASGDSEDDCGDADGL
jgi:hypothetical protein